MNYATINLKIKFKTEESGWCCDRATLIIQLPPLKLSFSNGYQEAGTSFVMIWGWKKFWPILGQAPSRRRETFFVTFSFISGAWENVTNSWPRPPTLSFLPGRRLICHWGRNRVWRRKYFSCTRGGSMKNLGEGHVQWSHVHASDLWMNFGSKFSKCTLLNLEPTYVHMWIAHIKWLSRAPSNYVWLITNYSLCISIGIFSPDLGN